MYNQELENTVAQILFHNQELLDSDIIEADDFYTETKDFISKMITLRKNGNLINQTTLGKTFDSPTPDEFAQTEDLIIALKVLNKERRIQTLPKQMSIIVTDNISLDEKIHKILTLVDKFNTGASNINEYDIVNMVDEYKKYLFETDLSSVFVKTGITELDIRCTNGFRVGESIIIAGDTGNYKSTLIYNMIINMLLNGKKVMLFAYEVPREQVLEILASYFTDIDSTEIRSGAFKLDKNKIEKINDKLEFIKTLPITIVDTCPSINDIKLMAMKVNPHIIF